MPDLLSSAPPMRKWAETRDALANEARKIADRQLEHKHRCDRLHAEYDKQMAEAVANGLPTPEQPNTGPNATLERMAADVRIRQDMHRDQRAAAIRESAAYVEDEAVKIWEQIRAENVDRLSAIERDRATLNAVLVDLADVRRAEDPNTREGGLADRTVQNLTLEVFAEYVRDNVPAVGLTPPPRPEAVAPRIERMNADDEVNAINRRNARQTTRGSFYPRPPDPFRY